MTIFLFHPDIFISGSYGRLTHHPFLSFAGVDAYRVVTGAEMLLGQKVDPGTELVMTKCSELLAEAIPGKLSFICSSPSVTNNVKTNTLC
jgi:hypothetical protein